jgi:hypothetical protein
MSIVRISPWEAGTQHERITLGMLLLPAVAADAVGATAPEVRHT